jgi:hypothetical protein
VMRVATSCSCLECCAALARAEDGAHTTNECTMKRRIAAAGASSKGCSCITALCALQHAPVQAAVRRATAPAQQRESERKQLYDPPLPVLFSVLRRYRVPCVLRRRRSAAARSCSWLRAQHSRAAGCGRMHAAPPPARPPALPCAPAADTRTLPGVHVLRGFLSRVACAELAFIAQTLPTPGYRPGVTACLLPLLARAAPGLLPPLLAARGARARACAAHVHSRGAACAQLRSRLRRR